MLPLFIVFTIALFITSCSQDNRDKYDILYSDYVNYHNSYISDIEGLDKLSDEWNEIIENSDVYTIEGYITKLTENTNAYLKEYEYFQTHQQEYISFLDQNKDDLEVTVVDFSVVEMKREIQDEDIRVRQNMLERIDYINSLITYLEQEEQSSEADIQALTDLASLFTMFI